jgi:hypothetical protein
MTVLYTVKTGTFEVYICLRYGAVSLRNWCPTFRNDVNVSSSSIERSKFLNVGHQSARDMAPLPEESRN